MDAQTPLFLEYVFATLRQNHPATIQANLFADAARAELLKSQGGFDMKLFGDYDSKIFKDKTYFSIGEYGVKLPTWYGLELKTGFSTASGNFLDPEKTLPAAGQAIAGLDWTVGRGLILDDRRATLFQAKKGIQLAENERLVALNDLFFAAAKSYWSWVVAREQVRILEQSLDRAQVRFVGLRENFKQGDKSAIDTLEAFILVQTRQFELVEKQQEAREAAILLNNFLWQTPPDATNFKDLQTAPPLPILDLKIMDETVLTNFNQQVRGTHPAVRASFLKLEILEIERRLKNENRKPELNFSYNFLASGWSFFPGNEGFEDVFVNNVKFGAHFSYPIPNRKARGDLQKTQIKIAATAAALDQKTRELENKLRGYANDLNTLAEQIALFQSITENYRRMLEGEQEKFSIGESTVFLINSREQKLLEANLKLAKLLGEYQKARVAVDWSLGILK